MRKKKYFTNDEEYKALLNSQPRNWTNNFFKYSTEFQMSWLNMKCNFYKYFKSSSHAFPPVKFITLSIKFLDVAKTSERTKSNRYPCVRFIWMWLTDKAGKLSMFTDLIGNPIKVYSSGVGSIDRNHQALHVLLVGSECCFGLCKHSRRLHDFVNKQNGESKSDGLPHAVDWN